MSSSSIEDTGIAAYVDSSIPGPNDAYLFLAINNECARFLLKDCAHRVSGVFALVLDEIYSKVPVSVDPSKMRLHKMFLHTKKYLCSLGVCAESWNLKENFYVKTIDGMWCPKLPNSYESPTMVIEISAEEKKADLYPDTYFCDNLLWFINLSIYGRRERHRGSGKYPDWRYPLSDKIHVFFEHDGGLFECECEGKSAADLILG